MTSRFVQTHRTNDLGWTLKSSNSLLWACKKKIKIKYDSRKNRLKKDPVCLLQLSDETTGCWHIHQTQTPPRQGRSTPCATAWRHTNSFHPAAGWATTLTAGDIYLGLCVWSCFKGFHSFLLTQYNQPSPRKRDRAALNCRQHFKTVAHFLRSKVRLTQRFPLCGETSKQEDLVRRHGREGVPRPAHRTLLRDTPTPPRSRNRNKTFNLLWKRKFTAK